MVQVHHTQILKANISCTPDKVFRDFYQISPQHALHVQYFDFKYVIFTKICFESRKSNDYMAILLLRLSLARF